MLGLLLAAGVAVAALLAVPSLRTARDAARRETNTLNAFRSTAAATLDSLRLQQQMAQASLTLELARATARDEPKLHLVIAVDSGTVALVRDGIALRTMPAAFRGAALRRGTQIIAQIAGSPVAAAVPTVDSLGNRMLAAAPELAVERVSLSDGTVLEGGDAATALLGGRGEAGERLIIVSRRDFAAIRPNLVRGMKAVAF